MNLSDPSGISEAQSLYEILEVRPDASPAEIRSAYLRAKASFQRDSLALYSLMGEEDAQRMLRQIEEAFLVLSNPDRKRLYDQSNLRAASMPSAFGEAETLTSASSVISIDRVPPMSQGVSSEELLIPPSTDFGGTLASESLAPPPQNPPTPVPTFTKTAPTPVAPVTNGAELREVRERKNVSIDYLVEITRIRKTYIQALETESFDALPAAVYIRGFLKQIARELHIPAEPLTTLYLQRHAAWRDARELSNSKK
jgi:hypothetical protein